MKNKFFILLLIYILANTGNYLLANNFTFNTSEVEVLENGNLIKASKGVATSNVDNLRIKANNFTYQRELSTLTASGNSVATSTEKGIQIKADKLKYNELSLVLTATGNVEVTSLDKKILLKSDNILYDAKLKTIKSNTPATIKDNIGNYIEVKNFNFLINQDLIKLNFVKVTDIEKNITLIEKAYIDLVKNKIVGKDISIDFNEKSAAKGNEPRIKGKTILVTEQNSIINKGVFTTCKKNDDCPPWQMSAKEIKHDKKKKTINYKMPG